MTSGGNAAASSDTSNFYNGSFEFDGTGDGITCPDNTDFEFGSGDFTVECWVKQMIPVVLKYCGNMVDQVMVIYCRKECKHSYILLAGRRWKCKYKCY